MKPADYVDQSASGLALSLIEGAVDIDDFTVFRTGTIGGGDVTLRAAIIGASHVLSFETDGAALTEMFACTKAPGGASQVFFGSLGDLLKATTELTFVDGRRYRFKASLMPLASPITEAAVKRFRGRTARGPRHLRLVFTFPRDLVILGIDAPRGIRGLGANGRRQAAGRTGEETGCHQKRRHAAPDAPNAHTGRPQVNSLDVMTTFPSSG